MKLRQLEYFCAVAEAESISAAARELHVAQPPISRQIAQLEEELGVQLFLRGSSCARCRIYTSGNFTVGCNYPYGRKNVGS